MTTHKVVIALEGGKLKSGAAAALDPLAEHLFNVPGTRIMAIVELQRAGQYDPDPSLGDDRKAPRVFLRTALMEVVDPDDHESDEALRRAMQALKLRRSAVGTLLENGDVELSDGTLSQCAGILALIEASKLRAAVKTHADRVDAILRGSPGGEALRVALEDVRDGLWAAASTIREFDDDDPGDTEETQI